MRASPPPALCLFRVVDSYHIDCNIDDIVKSIHTFFTAVTGKTPKFKVHGGTVAEGLALQNIQARMRMVLSYLFAQLLLWVRGRSGALLVLGSANVDESLRGYMTKYDCSSADINPIGAISKKDLRRFLAYARDSFDLPVLDGFLHATPTAELEPTTADYVQSDEADMGMTYEELSVFGRLRKVERCGPFSMFGKLVRDWRETFSRGERSHRLLLLAKWGAIGYEPANGCRRGAGGGQGQEVFLLLLGYASETSIPFQINRHKLTVLTPSYHAEAYSPDDNRYDLRPFLYNAGWSWQFRRIDEEVRTMDEALKRQKI
ncbi:MAG: protein QNS-1, isoform c [Olpidium bornovanus]|uniref:NAD(+) synthase (glutamine-hydrolyzing) n=1 Tax=Olpidium bornovanus TaxID=278681 RepID=A0A8H8DK85_9FUNG|nr:MAG: protein QNS-1, isoform c [Olpidium bornovanus]